MIPQVASNAFKKLLLSALGCLLPVNYTQATMMFYVQLATCMPIPDPAFVCITLIFIGSLALKTMSISNT